MAPTVAPMVGAEVRGDEGGGPVAATTEAEAAVEAAWTEE